MGQFEGDDDGARRRRDRQIFIDNVRALAAQATGPEVGGLERIEGCDPAAVVFAVVDPVGRFVDIHVTDGWAGRMGAAGLGRAVVDALTDARSRAALAGLVLARHGLTPRGAPERPQRHRPEPLPPEDDDGWLRAVTERVEAAHARLDSVERSRAERTDPRPRTVHGPSGLVEVRVLHGDVTEVWIDQGGLSPSATGHLNEDLRVALREAAESGATAGR